MNMKYKKNVKYCFIEVEEVFFIEIVENII